MAVVAKQAFRVAGRFQMVTKGELFEDGDPIVKAHPHLFHEPEEAARAARRPQSTAELGDKSMSARRINVERATAAPGELREVSAACDVEGCDFVAKSPAGLGAHKRTHQGDDQE